MKELKIKIWADGADRVGMLELNKNPMVKGFTTNPTLMRKVGLTDYEKFAHEILLYIRDKPISFEVFADDFKEMERQALQIKSLVRFRGQSMSVSCRIGCRIVS